MNMLTIGALIACALGLAAVRGAPPAARLLAWLLALAFAAVTWAAPGASWRAAATVPAGADVGGTALAARTSAAGAVVSAGPRAVDLVLRWRAPLAAAGNGPLGALSEAPPALPVQPEDLQVRALAAPARDRPLALQVDAPVLETPFDAELIVRAGAQVVHREVVRVGAAPAVVTWTPAQAGAHTIELVATVAGHRITAAGELTVADAPSVLVLEPSGVTAAALKVQGATIVQAAVTPDWPPDDWKRYAAVVVGQALSADAQRGLVAAIQDGAGAFVLSPGFGAPGDALRELLPLQPRPEDPGASGSGAGAGAEGPAAPPKSEPPPPPKREEPPRGETAKEAPVAPEPIEVDKRAIAMVLVVDRSGSMGAPLGDGHTKMSYAKTSALRTARALGAGDRVAVVTFGNKNQGRIELPMTDAADEATVHAGISRLAHSLQENTFLRSGVQRARELLRSAEAAVKHVVVITDGEFRLEEAMALRGDAHAMKTDDHITLSIISIVDAHTDQAFMREAELLTRDGGGQFLPVDEPGTVPALVSAEVTRSLQRVGRQPRRGDGSGEPPPETPPQPAQSKPAQSKPAPPRPEPPPPVPPPPAPESGRVLVRAVADSALLLPLPAGEWPTLARAVAGTAPLDAQVLLVAGDEGWPLLAFGNRGLGRVGAFAADLGGDAGAEFRAEAAFPARLSQWVQSVLPAQPATAPAPLLRQVKVEPVAPTPRDVAGLVALAGAPPAAAAAPPPRFVRELLPVAPHWSRWLLFGLVLLALAERLLGTRALRRGSTA